MPTRRIIAEPRSSFLTLGALACALVSSAPARAGDACDPAHGVIYIPAQGTSGVVLFEDSWPQNSDLDFNDAVVAYNYELLRDSAGAVVELEARINVQAAGATLHNGVYLHLPVALAASAVSITDQSGHAVQPMAGESDLVIPLAADTLALFAPALAYVNTESAQPVSAGAAFSFDIKFATGVAIDTGAAPFDLFLARSSDYGHQIHLPQYAGTAAMTPSLFGSIDDRSTAGGLHFINENGLPFALALPSVIAWPQERVSIDSVYGELAAFASSGGTENPGWYTEDIDASLAYTHGANGAAPPSVVLAGSSLTCAAPPPAAVCVAAGAGPTSACAGAEPTLQIAGVPALGWDWATLNATFDYAQSPTVTAVVSLATVASLGHLQSGYSNVDGARLMSNGDWVVLPNDSSGLVTRFSPQCALVVQGNGQFNGGYISLAETASGALLGPNNSGLLSLTNAEVAATFFSGGLNATTQLPDGNVAVSSGANVLELAAADGSQVAVLGTGVPSSLNLAAGPDGAMYVSDFSGGTLSKAPRGGVFTTLASNPTGSVVEGMTVLPNGDVLQGNLGHNAVERFDGNSGLFLGTVASGFSGSTRSLQLAPNGRVYLAGGDTLYRLEWPTKCH